jgi:hypothetical protein
MAVEAIWCELFSGPNSLLTGKFTGTIEFLAGTLEGVSPLDSALAGKGWLWNPIRTENDPEMSRELKLPVTRIAAKGWRSSSCSVRLDHELL